MVENLFSIQFVAVTTTFFLLMDGLGNIPLFLSLLRSVPPKRIKKIILREAVIALLVMLLFSLCGQFVLHHLGIQNQSIQIAGGIILFIIALKMIFTNEYEKPNHPPIKEPFIVPLAIPLIAGPSVLATIMVYSDNDEIKNILWISIFTAWLFTTIILLLSAPIRKLLGERGLSAVEKLMGLMLTLIAVQLFLDGLHAFLLS